MVVFGINTKKETPNPLFEHRRKIMPAPTHYEGLLIRRIETARLLIQQLNLEKQHAPTCPIQDDTSHAPCSCGANDHNAKIKKILDQLVITA